MRLEKTGGEDEAIGVTVGDIEKALTMLGVHLLMGQAVRGMTARMVMQAGTDELEKYREMGDILSWGLLGLLRSTGIGISYRRPQAPR